MLPQKLPLDLMQTQWAQELNPLLKQPLNQGLLLQGVSLASGANVINHLLGRKLQGWFLTRLRSSVTIYDTQDLNPNPSQTLSLVSSGAVKVDLFVF